MTTATAIHEEVLALEDCRAFLARTSVGRVAVNVDGWPPLIRPVTYAYDPVTRTVVFRSGVGSKLTALLLSSRAAFEIDGTHDASGVAWSVIGLGQAEPVERPEEVERLEALGIEPWAPGDKPFWIRLRLEHLSGRRLTREPR